MNPVKYDWRLYREMNRVHRGQPAFDLNLEGLQGCSAYFCSAIIQYSKAVPILRKTFNVRHNTNPAFGGIFYFR